MPPIPIPLIGRDQQSARVSSAWTLNGPVIFVRVVYWISATVMSPVVLLIVAAPQSVGLPLASNLQP
jgi:hypothetical protein